VEWTRRQVLRAIGTTAAAAMLPACGGRGAPVAGGGALRARPMAAIRSQLRDLVADLGRRYPGASGMAMLRVRGGARLDGGSRDADAAAGAAAVLAVGGELQLEEATSDVSAWGLRQAADRLVARAGAGSRRPAIDFGRPVDGALPVGRDPAARTPQQWLEELEALYDRSRGFGGSRIVYRGAHLEIDDLEQVVVGDGIDRSQRVVRTRAGVLLVAWTGTEPTAADAIRAGTVGLEALDAEQLPGEAIARAADDALAALTARRLDRFDGDLVLDPSCTALLARRALAPALDASRWLAGMSRAPAEKMLGTPLVGLIDDATAAGGFGSYLFDDEGTPAARTVLVDKGAVLGPFTDRATAAGLRRPPTGNGRRPGPLAPAQPLPSNLALAAGDLPVDALLATGGRGLLLEGALAVDVDLRSWRFALRAARARGLDNGKRSGALYRAVDLRGDLRALLGGVRGVSAERGHHPVVDGGVAVDAAGPYLLTRAEVRGA
jgi:TldD protein